MKRVNDPMQKRRRILNAVVMSQHHQQNTNTFGDINRSVA